MRPLFYPLLFGALSVFGLFASLSFSSSSSAAAEKVPGLYQGISPCGDCEAIEEALYLYPDGSFYKISSYFGPEPGSYLVSGRWTEDEDGHIRMLRSDNRVEGVYALADNHIRLLDTHLQPYEGDLAPFYQLYRVASFR